jgi:hypothetical protein
MVNDEGPLLQAGLAMALLASVLLLPDIAQAGGITNWDGAMEQVSEEAQGAGNAAGPLILMGLGIALFYGFNQIVGQGLAALGAAAFVGSAAAIWTGLGFGAGAGGGSIFDTTIGLARPALTATGVG